MLNLQKEDVVKIYQHLCNYINQTPILTSSTFNRLTRNNLFFKCENFQKTGSFKIRGAIHAVRKIKAQKPGFSTAITHSSGNFGQAFAFACDQSGIKPYVIVPEDAPRPKVDAMKNYGAEIVFCKPGIEHREETLRIFLEQHPDVEVFHPYNQEEVIEGHTSIIYELNQQLHFSPDYILVPIGGGGLISGIALASSLFYPQAKIIGIEPTNANDALLSLQSGEIVKLKNVNTIADGLKTSLGTLTFPIIQRFVDQILTVSDEEILQSTRFIAERMKIIVEPSSATVFAGLLKYGQQWKNKNIVLILTGGNIDPAFYGK